MQNNFDIRYFAHSWVSDWNHGNAHFLRGLVRALLKAGEKVRCYEELGSWSLSNLIKQEDERAITAIDDFRKAFPELKIQFYRNDPRLGEWLARELRGADIVILHEWNHPRLVNHVLGLKSKLGFRVLLHDTHHRSYTSPREILQFNLHLFDGVLAFGEAVRRIYANGFGVERAWTLHEAADVESFRPLAAEKSMDALWIGNWGDDERTREMEEFLVQPAEQLSDLKFVAYGVRYPEAALARFEHANIEFRGYLPNLRSPQAYNQAKVALHIPRRQYANGLSGIPTIRMFEAMACGAFLLCSPWQDDEGLFRAQQDYVSVGDGAAMQATLREMSRDERARAQIANNGFETIRQRHTCAHRAAELIEICKELGA
ncbi:MAG TPA: glycosyltransferase [Terriglobales bacterium]|nr:glycosyltransferase [Terriglobales bacterium]